MTTFPWRIIFQKKRIVTNLSCPFCSAHMETMCHLIWECKVSKKIQNTFFPSNVGVFYVGRGSWSSSDYWECLKEINPKQQMGKILTLLWSIWTPRNVIHFNQGSSDERSITYAVESLLEISFRKFPHSLPFFLSSFVQRGVCGKHLWRVIGNSMWMRLGQSFIKRGSLG